MEELILQNLSDEIGAKSLQIALLNAQLTTTKQECESVQNELVLVRDEYEALKALTHMTYDPETEGFKKMEVASNDEDNDSDA